MTEASEWTGKVYAAEHALFKAERGTPGIVGIHGVYQWLTMFGCEITNLLRLCPDVVLNKYLAVTSIDSGTLQLTDEEKRDGWWISEEARVFRGTSWGTREDRDDWKVAYSPRIESIRGLPNEPVEDCGKLLGDVAAVSAMLDRLLHHGHILNCGPRSWRTKTAMNSRNGSQALADGVEASVRASSAGLFSCPGSVTPDGRF